MVLNFVWGEIFDCYDAAKSDMDSYRLHRKVCSVLCRPLFPVNTSTWLSGNVLQCGSCCNTGALRWPRMFLPLWMQTHTYISGTYEILHLRPIKKMLIFFVWSEAVWYMTWIRNTHFSNTHQRCKQISDKDTFLRSTVREEHDFTEGDGSSTAYRSKEGFYEPLTSNIWQSNILSSKRSLVYISMWVV